MVYWNQNSGNNVVVTGWDLNGDPKSPAYNSKMGFADGKSSFIFLSGHSVFWVGLIKNGALVFFLGAQNDIFSGAPSSNGLPASSGSGGSGSKGGSGSSPPAANPSGATTTSTPPGASPSPGTPSPNSGTTALGPVKAPSCKKRRRSVDDVSLVKKSNLAGGPAHRRNTRRNW
jgi:hypothetical protein